MREPDMASHRRALLELVQHGIYLYRQFADDGRLLHMIGENGKTDLVTFREDDYDWDNDFVPEVYSGRPMSRSARISEVIEFMGAQMFTDDIAAERARKLLGEEYAYATTSDPFPEDRARAKRENLEHLRDPSAVLQAQTYDTHRIHIEEHRKYMRTVEFENLPPEQRQTMMMHDELHELMAMGAEGAASGGEQQQQPMQPGPEGAPPGVESPPSGGASLDPAPPPSVTEFAQMDEAQQRSTDQQ